MNGTTLMGIGVGVLLMLPGLFAAVEGDSKPLERILGFFVVCIGLAVVVFAVGTPEGTTWKPLDSQRCVEYVFMEDKWLCVPKEQAG